MPYKPLHTGERAEFTLFFQGVNRQFPGHRKPFWGSKLGLPRPVGKTCRFTSSQTPRRPYLPDDFCVFEACRQGRAASAKISEKNLSAAKRVAQSSASYCFAIRMRVGTLTSAEAPELAPPGLRVRCAFRPAGLIGQARMHSVASLR